MKLKLPVLILLAALGSAAAAQPSEFVAGRACYTEGEFKKAAAHFRLALKSAPNDAESNYWMGMSYQMLADIASPFGHKYRAKARVYLTKSVELAPTRTDYRRELHNFLLDSAGSSRDSAAQAADALLGGMFLAVPRVAWRIVE
jgi:tetratricopeptide (TPR) repeat protein